MKIITKAEITDAAECLRNGGLVAFPTETVYGLGANALNPIAVARIFEVKERPSFDPLIVHITDIAQLSTLYEKPINPLVYRLAEKFWPGPLTIVHKKSSSVPDIVSSGLDTVAVRMPAHSMAFELIKKAGVPVAAPSANKFGQLSPTRYEHVVKQNMDIDYILAGDTDDMVGIESTVVSVDGDMCTILRPGVITPDDLKKTLSAQKVTVAEKNIKLSSPGLLNSHYSPVKPLYFIENQTVLPAHSGIILHSRTSKPLNAEKVIYTSQNGKLLEVAAHLFMALHQMEDDKNIERIYIEKVPNEGVGAAVMDRLNKAVYQYKNN